jgi:hypothetical protein
MKKKSLAAAIPFIFAAGFAVAEGTSGTSGMSTGQGGSQNYGSGASSASNASSASSASSASGMDSRSTTTGMKGQEVPVPRPEVNMSTDESRAEEITQRARQLSNDQQSDLERQSSGGMGSGSSDAGYSSNASGGDDSRGARGMDSRSTTTGMKGQEVPVPETEVRTSTDESRADEIMQRARQLSNDQQSGMRQSSGGMESGSRDAGYSSGMNSAESSSSSHSSSGEGGQEQYHQQSTSGSTSGMSGGAVHSQGSRGMSPAHADEKAATTGSSNADGSTFGGVSSPVPSGERSGYGRIAPPESEAGQSNMMQQGDPNTGWGRVAPPESGTSQGTR